MFAIATLMALVQQVSGTPYISGGDSPAGTDCSGLASWVSNMATGRPVYGDRFNTGNQERALLARGFKYGTQPGALVIGWNSGHTAVTLPDGTPVSSGEGGHGVRVGGGGAYQRQFNHHMYLPVAPEAPQDAPVDAPLPFGAPPPPPAPIEQMAAPAPVDPFAPPPPADPFAPPPADPMAAPAPVDPMAAPAPMDPFAPPPPADAMPPVAPMDAPAPIVLDVPPPPAPPAPEEPAPIAI
ncbi:glycoside hydrolase [Mycolicibacterium setense]|uniref:Glycoside hydrolase n=1 Tax=Mycolicibacterium setense TaxID=431269 RepID=A0ABR4YU04_9MYCO|nr:glycoside hydrolase [Mycolicibacterium setense]KHO20577.1 glycoside hydrolase [Mycolicibacterium setense]KHO25392.1 glycoside hydrolase [Mycolicibacterium setense]MCV7109554.1 peptidoglycan endopeptidase [Mycolicibacterium setense]